MTSNDRTGHRPGLGALQRALRLNERLAVRRTRTGQDRAADLITRFAGSMPFVYLHAVWFTLWILLNEGVFGRGAIFDRYPFGLLTMVVSLEAIFLSTFVMVSQNREAARQDIRADLDFETNLRSEIWLVHVGKALNLDPVAVEQRVQEILSRTKAEIDAGEPVSPIDAEQV